MQLTPVIAIHMSAALAAAALGPIALWARQGATQRPRLHRARLHRALDTACLLYTSPSPRD